MNINKRIPLTIKMSNVWYIQFHVCVIAKNSNDFSEQRNLNGNPAA